MCHHAQPQNVVLAKYDAASNTQTEGYNPRNQFQSLIYDVGCGFGTWSTAWKEIIYPHPVSWIWPGVQISETLLTL